jgi:hypothetical protein
VAEGGGSGPDAKSTGALAALCASRRLRAGEEAEEDDNIAHVFHVIF